MTAYRDYAESDNPQAEEGDAVFHGVNARLAPDKLPTGILSDALNVRMREGEAQTRPGIVKPGWLNVTSAAVDDMIRPVGTFYGCGVFKDPDSIEWVLLAADGGIYRHKPHNGRFALTLPTGVQILSRVTFTQAFNKMYCFRGRHLQPLVMNEIDDGFEDLVARWSSSATYNAAVLVTGQEAAEIAYGPFIAVSSLTSVGNTATVVTTAEHGYVTGADVTIKGASPSAYNGRWNITVVDVNTFTYSFPGGTSPATGTIKVSNNAYYWQAAGSRVTLTSITRALQVATATKATHGFSNGQYVTIAGANEAEYNGTFVISNVTANTFDFTVTGAPATPATGTITAQTSIVLAGQDPDTNPEAWDQVYNILPNADDALYINNRLLVPTAYTPGATDYDSTSTYTKKDFIVATDVLDDLHFDFENEFRINQGSDDEIVQLAKYSPDAVIVWKEKTWGILTGVALDLTDLALDMRGKEYGACAPGSVVAGKDVLFPVSKRGVCSLRQNALGEPRNVDIPFTHNVQRWVDRIDWRFADQMRLAWWDDRLYAAVPMPAGTTLGPDLVDWGNVVIHPSALNGHWPVSLVEGEVYSFELGNAVSLATGRQLNGDTLLWEGIGTVMTEDQQFTATTNIYYMIGPEGVLDPLTATVRKVTVLNSALFVYDYRAQGQEQSQDPTEQSGKWASLDTGEGLMVKEFFKATYNGQERLFYIAEDGYANMLEESDAGDQVRNDNSESGLSFADIPMSVSSRGYRYGNDDPKKFKQVGIVLAVWNALYSIFKRTGAAHSVEPVREDQEFSRTKYLKPVGRAAYVEGNAGGDWDTPGRGDYSVPLETSQVEAGTGLGFVFQEVLVRASVRTGQGRYTQFIVTNSRGRLKVRAMGVTAEEGQRRDGLIV